MFTDFSAQPQTSRDHQRNTHPEDGALSLDPQFIGLYLSQAAWSLDQIFMHLLRMLPPLLPPVLDRSLIKAEGGENRLDWAPVRKQGHDQRDDIGGFPQAVKENPGRRAERLATLAANVTAVFLGMQTDAAYSNLPSGRVLNIGAERGFWGQRRFFFLTHHSS
jgi:hypothetical protein